jgi:hypothetical protein
MSGEITTIESVRMGKKGVYYVVCFRMDGGGSRKTYLCPAFANFRHWKDKLQVGNVLGSLALKGGLVNADSQPTLIKKAQPTLIKKAQPPKPAETQLYLF